MKNLILSGAVLALLFSACSEAGDGASKTIDEKVNNLEVAQKACDANVASSAAKCLCDLIDRLNNSDDMSDEEYEKLEAKIDALNTSIDRAIEDGKYNEDELVSEASKIDCTF